MANPQVSVAMSTPPPGSVIVAGSLANPDDGTFHCEVALIPILAIRTVIIIETDGERSWREDFLFWDQTEEDMGGREDLNVWYLHWDVLIPSGDEKLDRASLSAMKAQVQASSEHKARKKAKIKAGSTREG